MTRATRWAVPALVALIPLGLMFPAVAQRGGEESAPYVEQAKQTVALIEQGQLNLTDATEMAEKHVRGKALSASSIIQPAEAKTGETDRPGGPAPQEGQVSGKRLIYHITCFVKDKVKLVQVDGLAKKVIENQQPSARR